MSSSGRGNERPPSVGLTSGISRANLLHSLLLIRDAAGQQAERGRCLLAGQDGHDMIAGEESQIDWIETQLETIQQIGTETYLSQQVKGE